MISHHIRDIIKCVRCGRCRAPCPSYEVLEWESTGARGRMLIALSLATGLFPTEHMLTGLNTCTTCDLCKELCPSGANPRWITVLARRDLALKGHRSEAQETLYTRVRDYGNSLGETLPRRNWYKGEVLLKGDYVYFVGCLSSYRLPEIAASNYEILGRFDVALLLDERCCGSPLLKMGLDATELIEHNLSEIEKTGASTVITGCPGCMEALKENYHLKVLHSSEFFAGIIGELDLKPIELKVSYHDPCHLGRGSGIYEAPRKVLKNICSQIEMAGHKEKARCCGGGGGVRASYREISIAMAKRRLQDSPEKAEYIATTCPMCKRNLTDAGGKVLDISEIVGMALKA